MSKYTWPVSLLEGYGVEDTALTFFQKYVEDCDKGAEKAEALSKEHQLLKDTSAKHERYIAELEKQIGILQKTLDLVDKNIPRFILKADAVNSNEIIDLFKNEPVILHSEADSIIPIYPDRWIPVTERLPTIYDADADNCVLAIHKASNKRYYHWSSVADNPFDFTHWMETPQPPKGE